LPTFRKLLIKYGYHSVPNGTARMFIVREPEILQVATDPVKALELE
jgi:hypothetical protein